MPAWADAGWDEYARRIHGRCKLNLIEVAAEKRGKNVSPTQIAEREATRLRRAIPAGARVIALDRSGQSMTTKQIAKRMETALQHGDAIALIAGGADGLAPEFIAEADEIWSLSALTFAHPLIRPLIAEQIYRCYSLLERLPYHR